MSGELPYSEAICRYLKELTQARGRAKQTYLKEFERVYGTEQADLFRKFLHYTYEPSITYGVTEDVLPATPGYQHPHYDINHPIIWETLEALANRTLTGNAARDVLACICRQMEAKTHGLMINILSRDARAGVGASTINNAFPGLISTFEVMLAAKYESAKIRFPVMVEPKFDGMRTIAVEQIDGGWQYFTRSGKTIDTIPSKIDGELSKLANLLRRLPGYSSRQIVFDGELMGSTFQDTMKHARRKDGQFDNGIYHVFDVLPKKVFYDLINTEYATPYLERRQHLESVFKEANADECVKLPRRYMVGSMAELDRFFDNVRKDGQEGLILKQPGGLYRPTRHRDWMKMKAEETLDLPIVDIEQGTGKYAHCMGALVVDHKGVRVSVGTGFSDEQRELFWKMWHMDHSMRGMLIEVSFQEETPDGSLRHPRFVKSRLDKSVPESEWA